MKTTNIKDRQQERENWLHSNRIVKATISQNTHTHYKINGKLREDN